jgi:hypothetical protein
MRKLRALLVSRIVSLALVSVTTAGLPALAHAQPADARATPGKEQAKKLFEEGVELEKKGDYVGALAKYKDAEQITVTPGLRFHTGYCLEMSGKLAAALEVYDAADKLAREQNKQDVHAAVTARIDPLRARVPQIAIRLATPAKDGEVQLDGVAVAPAMLEGKSFRIDPGEHTVTAHAPGYKSFSRRVQVPENVTTTVDVSLDRASPAAPIAAAPDADAKGTFTEPPAEPRPQRSLALPIATTAGAVVLAGAGLAMFFVADGAQADGQRDCAAKVTCDDERSRVRTFDALALGGFIGAAGLGVLSVILWTSKGSDSRAAASLVVKPTPGTLSIAATFR